MSGFGATQAYCWLLQIPLDLILGHFGPTFESLLDFFVVISLNWCAKQKNFLHFPLYEEVLGSLGFLKIWLAVYNVFRWTGCCLSPSSFYFLYSWRFAQLALLF